MNTLDMLKLVAAILVPMAAAWWNLSGRLTNIEVRLATTEKRVDKQDDVIFEPAWTHRKAAGK
jgi:hypothetical protein